ncbi:hypothetical protein QFZ30_000520 [Arthrobacter pascens]|uniref:HNH endonuclease signature motif containing protein n=1 Tax=Arthrobacter pascens TaxID=1677 RepID=UPI00278FE773|nr:HNH endonuclease signature motif containing protein [Arthrobacter pascens]MDQ0677138.1 hypothetical protein [Arthrobacter pascens]
MEAIGDQLAEYGGSVALLARASTPAESGTRASDGGAGTGVFDGGARPALSAHPSVGLADAVALVHAAAAAAPEELAMAGYVEAANYAGLVEELSRTTEYLQILGAGTVDRARTRAIAAAATTRAARTGRSWVTGWDHGTETLTETDAAWPNHTATIEGTTRPVPVSPADDGCRNTAEFLRIRLRIGITEARRRLRLAHDVLPATTLTGDRIPPAREHLAAGLTPTIPDSDTEAADPALSAAVAGPVVSSRAGTIISLTLDRLQHHTTPETLARIEQDLTRTAATAGPDFLARVARRWADTIDADGTEPTEEALRHTQGAFIRKPRHGLHHLEIFATTDQYEHLLTVMNTATNPRTHTTPTGQQPHTSTDAPATDTGTHANQHIWQDNDVDLDRRTRSQKQLDGIISAVKAGLTTNTLPTTGGNRPQILATINYQDLLPHTTHTSPEADQETGSLTDAGPGTGTGNFTFTGPVAATTLRKIACDADIIPALLGTDGEILDLGRKTRLFTAAQRLALTARDQGCTFPNCTIPAPWCEAHHITYWSHGGPTTPDNGTLLCSHHHHLIHKDQWTIQTTHGTPWYIPPPHIDPQQKPQQNHYFKPPPPPQTE